MNDRISVARLEQFLRDVTEIADDKKELSERRQLLIERLGSLVRAVAGFWAWGRGNPIDSAITPVASLYFGLKPDIWQQVIQLGLGAESVRLWSTPIRQRMQATSHVTVTRSMLHSDDEWARETKYRQSLNALGLDSLMVSVNYYRNDCWFHITLCRPPGEPDFCDEDALLLNLAVSSISWMQPRVSESVPEKTFVGLTPRQRVIMLNLLDGQSRKQIANHLGITLHTANDHIKAIYAHFKIQSATELAAKFLQSF